MNVSVTQIPIHANIVSTARRRSALTISRIVGNAADSNKFGFGCVDAVTDGEGGGDLTFPCEVRTTAGLLSDTMRLQGGLGCTLFVHVHGRQD